LFFEAIETMQMNRVSRELILDLDYVEDAEFL